MSSISVTLPCMLMVLLYISSRNVFQKLNWSKLNWDLRHVCDWMKLNQLTLNNPRLALRAKCRVHLALLIKRLLCTLINVSKQVGVSIYLQLFRERLSEKMCTRQSRKVTWDMINALLIRDTIAVEPTFVAFFYHSQTYGPWPLVSFFQTSLKNSEFETTHNTFRGLSLVNRHM